MEKITAKAAKEMYEHALKLESEYRHYISGMKSNFYQLFNFLEREIYICIFFLQLLSQQA